ncbi:MAG: glycosyltransferase, partial [Pseudomonadota bacterium]
MRIVLDLQGAQTNASRHRGIGRYSLAMAQAILRHRGEHEVLIALSGLFPDTIEPLRAAFDGLLPQDNIRIWQAPGPVSQQDPQHDGQRRTAECLREAFLAGLRPDMVHLSSLFEGFVDDAVTSVGGFTRAFPTAVTLYDLIPLIYRRSYLQDPRFEEWYEGKLGHLRRAQLWLAISESSRQEGIRCLNLPAAAVVNVSTDASAYFQKIPLDEQAASDLRQRHGLSRPFVMYTGGIDPRKNLEGLIRAYARLPSAVRRAHQLAIVCEAGSGERGRLEALARQQGLAHDELVLTGFVTEADLLALYNLCRLFVFPSWHEGFGLPALEAMRCGAPVIAANTSSLPEVIGWEEALFDSRSEPSMAAKIAQALTDETFRAELSRQGLQQARRFSWDESAQRALAAFAQCHAGCQGVLKTPVSRPARRPILAYVSPLPPEHSGIADYSAELLPELARHYDIEAVVAQEQVSDAVARANCTLRTPNWLLANARRVDRVIYHFGNSGFHDYMLGLLPKVPGVVVLHDFFLSGLYAYRQWRSADPWPWRRELLHAHGYAALRDHFTTEIPEVERRYPANLTVLQQAQGVIVHSEHSRVLACQWHGEGFSHDWAVIPHLRVLHTGMDRAESRQQLGLKADDFVVCSVGILAPTKLNHRLLAAWLGSALARDKRCVLVFVGQNHSGVYGQRLLDTLAASGLADRIRITGWADTHTFRRYLAAADVAVQLRTWSRGESSGTVLDTMAQGLPTLVNAHGSMAELPGDAVWCLPDEFTDAQLA